MRPLVAVSILSALCACSSAARPSASGAGGEGDTGQTGGEAGSAAGGGGNGDAGIGGASGGSGGSSTGGSGAIAPDASAPSGVPADAAPIEPDALATAPDMTSAPPSDAAPASTGGPGVPAGCVLKWSPSAMVDGDNAFEGIEMPDTRGTHPGVKHFYTVPDHNAYRVDQHDDPPSAVDLDTHPDRLRCEVKGMHAGGSNLALTRGQHWRITWSIYLPSTLKATTSFSDIFQMKFVDTGGSSSGSPVFTINLPNMGGVEKLQAQAQLVPGLGGFPAVDLPPLRDKWITSTFDFMIDPAAGSIHWILNDGTKDLVDVEKTGIDTWPSTAARLRPKWGLYRKLGSAGLQTTYMMFTDLKAYLCN